MVGEISPDGNFVWNGTEWMPKDAVTTNQQIVDESSNNYEIEELLYNNISKLKHINKIKEIAWFFMLVLKYEKILLIHKIEL